MARPISPLAVEHSQKIIRSGLGSMENEQAAKDVSSDAMMLAAATMLMSLESIGAGTWGDLFERMTEIRASIGDAGIMAVGQTTKATLNEMVKNGNARTLRAPTVEDLRRAADMHNAAMDAGSSTGDKSTPDTPEQINNLIMCCAASMMLSVESFGGSPREYVLSRVAELMKYTEETKVAIEQFNGAAREHTVN